MNSTKKKIIMFSALTLGVGLGVGVYFMQKELSKDSDERERKALADVEKGHPDDDLFPLSLAHYNTLATSQKRRASRYIKKLQTFVLDGLRGTDLWKECFTRRWEAQDYWDKKYNHGVCQKHATQDCERELKFPIDGKFTRKLERLLNNARIPSSIDNVATFEKLI